MMRGPVLARAPKLPTAPIPRAPKLPTAPLPRAPKPPSLVRVQPTESIFVPRPVVVQIPDRTLTAWNLAMSAFHTGLFVTTLVVGNHDLTVPVYKTDVTVERYNTSANLTGDDRPWRLIPSYVESGSFHFTWATASFFALSALFHLLNATLLRTYYLTSLSKCLSPTRYTEYFFSAAIMQLLIAYTLGVRERMLLVSSAVLVAITMPFGYWCEERARPRTPALWDRSFAYRISPWFLGHVPQVAAWAIVIVHFYDEDDNEAPGFVHAILWGELVLFFSFGFVALAQQLFPPSEFWRGELAFQVLSLVSKGTLGGLLLANVLMLSNFADLYDD